MSTKADTRQHLLDTAATMFHTGSYSGVGIAGICDQAGVSKGSFFHFFPSKRDLALAVADQFRQRIGETLVKEGFSTQYSPLARFDRFAEALYAFQKTQTEEHGHLPGCPFGNLALEQATQDDVIRMKVDSYLSVLGNQFRQTIAEAVRCGELPEVDEKATADAMLSYVEGIQLLAKARNDPEVIRRLGPGLKSIRIFSDG